MQLIKSIVFFAFTLAGVASAASLGSRQACNVNDVCGEYDSSGVLTIIDPCCPGTDCINGFFEPGGDPFVFCL
ncbi:hypothetical protein DFH07DRAFT_950810 [Mycena maculata]|uniref:SSCRP protein n=1 Tax=Mycena maculata TaxID=230809 RepID=A0AAD7K5L4_9AGAR|nr:hypothetical protein DFH07DRAFT_950810 [Mycena maculata]